MNVAYKINNITVKSNEPVTQTNNLDQIVKKLEDGTGKFKV